MTRDEELGFEVYSKGFHYCIFNSLFNIIYKYAWIKFKRRT